MADRDRTPVREVQDKRTKRLRVVGIAKLFDVIGSSSADRPRETRFFRGHLLNQSVPGAAPAKVLLGVDSRR
jgi:hypothetical protein